jgi:hypothetical protein
MIKTFQLFYIDCHLLFVQSNDCIVSEGATMLSFSRVIVLVGLSTFITANAEYRNVALNKNDVHHGTWTAAGSGYPHAYSNSEYAYPPGVAEERYYAKNAINGDTINSQHATMPYASWGPQKISGLWWRVLFGKQLEIDKLVIWIRADWTNDQPAPHDSYWKSATLVFSDSSKINITIDSTRSRQTKMLPKKTTNSLTFTNLVPGNPDKWCAFTEVQIWGDDPQTDARPSAPAEGKASCNGLVRPFSKSGRVTITPDIRGMEFYSVDGRRLGQWRRANDKGVVEIEPPAGSAGGIILARSFR